MGNVTYKQGCSAVKVEINDALGQKSFSSWYYDFWLATDFGQASDMSSFQFKIG
jgi:hypothetical protein